MEITIIEPDLSDNRLQRTHLLSEVLGRNHEVKIVGSSIDGGIWEPLNDAHDYRVLCEGKNIFKYLAELGDFMENLSGDVVYARKHLMNSYGLSILKKVSSRTSIVLDIEDWDSAAFDASLLKRLLGFHQLRDIHSYYYTRLLEFMSGLADSTTVANSFLQRKFGGTIIPHARDETVFDPSRFNKTRMRERFNLPTEDNLLLFVGTPRPHKGVAELIEAVNSLDRNDIIVVIVGATQTEYVERLGQMAENNLIVKGPQPFDRVPNWLATADIITIPQNKSTVAMGQIPAKVFDAMAMAKPIIATETSGLPEVLDGCGFTIERNSPHLIAEKIRKIIDNPSIQENMGQKARKKFLENYSYSAVAPKLDEIFHRAHQ